MGSVGTSIRKPSRSLLCIILWGGYRNSLGLDGNFPIEMSRYGIKARICLVDQRKGYFHGLQILTAWGQI